MDTNIIPLRGKRYRTCSARIADTRGIYWQLEVEFYETIEDGRVVDTSIEAYSADHINLSRDEVVSMFGEEAVERLEP